MSALTVPAAAPASFIATTPAQMLIEQGHMIQWCDRKVEDQKVEIAELERTIAEAQRVSLRDLAWKSRLALARRKMTFYRKVKAALLKGYYIVPPFPVQVFAIRVAESRKTKGDADTHRWERFKQDPQMLAEGEGRWVSPFPEVMTWTENNEENGKVVMKRFYEPGDWRDVDFPFKLVKPEIISAVAGAMEQKVFDTLGVLPERRQPDPLVVGQIIPPHRKKDPLTFFVAWWLDAGDL